MKPLEKGNDCLNEIEVLAELHGVQLESSGQQRAGFIAVHLKACDACQVEMQRQKSFDTALFQVMAVTPLNDLAPSLAAELAEKSRRWPVVAVAGLATATLVGMVVTLLCGFGLWQLGLAPALTLLTKGGLAVKMATEVTLLLGQSLAPLIQLGVFLASLLLIPLLPLILKTSNLHHLNNQGASL